MSPFCMKKFKKVSSGFCKLGPWHLTVTGLGTQPEVQGKKSIVPKFSFTDRDIVIYRYALVAAFWKKMDNFVYCSFIRR